MIPLINSIPNSVAIFAGTIAVVGTVYLAVAILFNVPDHCAETSILAGMKVRVKPTSQPAIVLQSDSRTKYCDFQIFTGSEKIWLPDHALELSQ